MSSPEKERASVPNETDTLGPEQRVVPSWTEPIGRDSTALLGGPLGTHAVVGRHWFWSPVRVGLLIAVVTLMLGWLQKSPCIQQFTDEKGVVQLDWSGSRQYVAMCYSDIVPLYTAERLDKPGMFPYKTSWMDDAGTARAQVRYMEYPVLTGLFQWVNAKVTHGYQSLAQRTGLLPTAMNVIVYFNVTALFLGLAWLITVWSVARTARRRPWDAVIVGASPLVVIQAFTNFDTLATMFAAAGILAWSRRNPVLAGVLLGLGGAAKLYPLFLLGPILLLCLRSGRLKEGLTTTGFALASWAAVNLPIYLLYPDGWREFFRLNTFRGVDPDSLYNVIQQWTDWKGFDPNLPFGVPPSTLNTVTAALFAVCCLGVGAIILTSPRRPRLAQVAFLVVAAFLLTNKVWSPQYSLWLVPLAALALPRWKILLAWMTVDALVWAPRMYFYLGEDKKGLPIDWFLGTVVARDLMVLLVCGLIIREIYRPEHDLVRQLGDDDPAGGVIDGAPDRFVLRSRPKTGDQPVAEPVPDLTTSGTP